MYKEMVTEIADVVLETFACMAYSPAMKRRNRRWSPARISTGGEEAEMSSPA